MGSHNRESKHHVFLAYEESSSGGDICEGEEDSDFPCRETEYIDFSPMGLFNQIGHDQEQIGVNFNPQEYTNQEVFMVVVYYSDGDTFGNSSGNWYVEGVYTDPKEAQVIKQAITDGNYCEDVYMPWKGYFADLESVTIWGTKLQDGPCTGIRWF